MTSSLLSTSFAALSTRKLRKKMKGKGFTKANEASKQKTEKAKIVPPTEMEKSRPVQQDKTEKIDIAKQGGKTVEQKASSDKQPPVVGQREEAHLDENTANKEPVVIAKRSESVSSGLKKKESSSKLFSTASFRNKIGLKKQSSSSSVKSEGKKSKKSRVKKAFSRVFSTRKPKGNADTEDQVVDEDIIEPTQSAPVKVESPPVSEDQVVDEELNQPAPVKVDSPPVNQVVDDKPTQYAPVNLDSLPVSEDQVVHEEIPPSTPANVDSPPVSEDQVVDEGSAPAAPVDVESRAVDTNPAPETKTQANSSKKSKRSKVKKAFSRVFSTRKPKKQDDAAGCATQDKISEFGDSVPVVVESPTLIPGTTPTVQVPTETPIIQAPTGPVQGSTSSIKSEGRKKKRDKVRKAFSRVFSARNPKQREDGPPALENTTPGNVATPDNANTSTGSTTTPETDDTRIANYIELSAGLASQLTSFSEAIPLKPEAKGAVSEFVRGVVTQNDVSTAKEVFESLGNTGLSFETCMFEGVQSLLRQQLTSCPPLEFSGDVWKRLVSLVCKKGTLSVGDNTKITFIVQATFAKLDPSALRLTQALIKLRTQEPLKFYAARISELLFGAKVGKLKSKNVVKVMLWIMANPASITESTEGTEETEDIVPPAEPQHQNDPGEENVVLCTVISVYDFEKAKESDMDMFVGDEIDVYEKFPDGWWRGLNKVTGVVGEFPSTFVREASKEQTDIVLDCLSEVLAESPDPKALLSEITQNLDQALDDLPPLGTLQLA